MKGKKIPVKVFRPYPENLGYHDISSDKLYLQSKNIHKSDSLNQEGDSMAVGTFPTRQRLRHNTEEIGANSKGNSDFHVTKTNSYGNRQKRLFRIVHPIQVQPARLILLATLRRS